MSEPLCATCGHPRHNHPYRHPFVGPSKDDTIEVLTVKLAKAVELLIVCRDMFDEVAHPSDPLSKMLNDTLAEIEGEKK